ncbi:type 1 glutamine amidotransferase domain-containing protein [Glutamicibacter sp.]|uniref:type 1 glutamine amidotransferase domain-containing protein n=1 Tax=Glutamicibacter sp. TaxID=1931995 RepID=UPI0028BDCDBE|nr:type 1 glutamine amidotransferase domain-containing protein [Glutamicibacter sp.]
MTSVLMVLSGAHYWTLSDRTQHPTGFWAEEFLVPYEMFKDQGYDVSLATPGAAPPTVDELSLGIAGGLPKKTRRYRAKLSELEPVLAKPLDLHLVDILEYDLVFFPGGSWSHGGSCDR